MSIQEPLEIKSASAFIVSTKIDGCIYGGLIRLGFDSSQIVRDKHANPGGSSCLVIVDAEWGGAGRYLDNLRASKPGADSLYIVINSTEELSCHLVLAHPYIRGVFSPDVSLESFCVGLARVLSGEVWLPGSICELLIAQYRNIVEFEPVVCNLSGRERDVMLSVADGLTEHQIAQTLGTAAITVNNHVYGALTKLGASNRARGASLVLGPGGR